MTTREGREMTHTQYKRLRNKAANRLAKAFAGGNAAVVSGDWRRMLEACKECDAAHLEMCRVQGMAKKIEGDGVGSNPAPSQ